MIILGKGRKEFHNQVEKGYLGIVQIGTTLFPVAKIDGMAQTTIIRLRQISKVTPDPTVKMIDLF
jgi:hypothetical protein